MVGTPANDIQKCIQQCQQTAQQIRTMANQETDQMAKMLLTEAAHHLDLCLVECQFSVQELQKPAHAMA